MKRKMVVMMLAAIMVLAGAAGTAFADDLLILDEMENDDAEPVFEMEEGSSVISGGEEVLDESTEKADLSGSFESIEELTPDEKISEPPENEPVTGAETIELVEVPEEGVYTSEPVAVGDDVPIDAEHFPDEAFRTYIKRAYIDENRNSVLDSEEIESVSSIVIYPSDGITDLKGIEYFKFLTSLKCSGSNLTSLDVRGNVSLEELYCSENQLSSLDVSGNPFLKSLRCDGNQLSSLDISGDVSLEELLCEDNQLISLDVSENLVLKILWCDGNQLGSLDVSRNAVLEELFCRSNHLNSLSVSENASLETLKCDYNQLSSLDVSGNLSLKTLECSNNQLSSLSVSGDPSLETLDCRNNQLNSLDASRDTSLKYLFCDTNQLSSLNVNGDISLETLNCFDNQLSSLDVSEDASLRTLNCGKNQLSSLDVRGDVSLRELNCDYNQLSSLDISENSSLRILHCSNNQLSSLDVRGKAFLEILWCRGNQLRNLNVNQNESLKNLNCDDNQLRNLNVNKNPSLEELSCSGNQLNGLDLSRNPFLKTLWCPGNQLSSLDVSGNSCLEVLSCYDNQLSSLDVSRNSFLEILRCDNNQLVSLDVSQNMFLNRFSSISNTRHIAAPVRVNGVWQLNLAPVLGNADLKRIVLKTKGASLSGKKVTFTGSEMPESLKYTYDTMGSTLSENDRLMSITLKWNTSQEIPDGTTNSDSPIRKKNQTISIDKTITKIYKKNGTFNLNATAEGKLTYKTGNAKIATVSSNGKVKVKKCGSVVITIKAAATTEYKAASVKVKLIIKDKKKQTISVNRTITKTYSRGEMFSLGAKAKGRLTYKSSNTKVAVVSAFGTVKITGYGTAVITVKAAATAEYKAAAATVQLTVGPGAVWLTSVTSEKKGYMKFKWIRNTQVSGYEISYSANKEFDSQKTGTAENSLTEGSASGLVSGRIYYARIRGYRLVNGDKVYGPWSAVKSCKIK